jgi:hypothetical protein
MKDYSLWLFLDLSGYNSENTAKIIEKKVRKNKEFRGTVNKRLYFEFKNTYDKLNFMHTAIMSLQLQKYRYCVVTESDLNVPL